LAKPPSDDDVLSFDEVFADDEYLRLTLSTEEWEVIIALAEAGGSGSFLEIRRITGMEPDVLQEVVKSLLDRSIASRDSGEAPSEAAREAPDAEVSQYLEYLSDMNYYQILQVGPEADQSEIRRSYYRLMREYSPDRFMRETNEKTKEQLKEIFRILTHSYEVLTDPDARKEYDLTIPDFTGAAPEEEEAIESLWDSEEGKSALMEANPDLARSFYDSAMEDFRNENYRSAELNFKLAVEMDPNNSDYQAGLSKTRRIVAKDRAQKEAIKAVYLEDEEKHQRAIKHMKRAIELDPEVAEYRYDLARMLDAEGHDLHAARMHMLLALDRHPGKLPYLRMFAAIQEKLEEYADARRTYKKILSLNRDDEEAKEAMDRLKRKEKGE